jgi:glycosyltransferase involved in cell wall biosynthesis
MVEHSGKGGMHAYTDALCTGLSVAGVDVTVLSSSAWPDGQKPFEVERQFFPLTSEQDRTSPLHWAADRFSRITANMLQRNRFALSGDFDVVHIQGLNVPLLEQLFLKPLKRRIPLVVTVHDVEPHYDRFVSRRGFLKASMQIPHRLIVHYSEGKKRLIDNWGVDDNRIDVIPHGIMPVERLMSLSQARRVLGLPAEGKIVLFFGSIRPNKGLDILIRAVDIMRRRQEQILLVIAGQPLRGMSFRSYSQLIESLELSDYVRNSIGFVPQQDVDKYFSACDVVALPYLQFEAQSGVLMRAYAHKKPVVVSSVGAMGELVSADRTGLVVNPGRPDLLAEAIIDALAHQEQYKSNYNPQLEAKYNWNNIADLTIRSYEKAVACVNYKNIIKN